ncbi:MAG: hypothetical protein HY822_23595 [Acidobacteria bacterium]|nr:hypothetical protein [Acidobacteriota bacterium]
MLLPPLPPRGQAVVLRGARTVTKAGRACDLAGSEIQLTWRGRTARVTLSPDVVAPAADVKVIGGPGTLTGTPLRDLSWWQRFQEDLDRTAKAGCLTERDLKSLAGRIVENVAMPSNLAWQLRYGNFVLTGYLDLTPEFALSTVAPLLKPGVAVYRGLDDIAGYETAWYDVKRRGEGGVRIALRGVEQNRGGIVTRARRPVTEVISLPDSARYARYYFRMWSVSGDRRIALLATPRPDLLGAAARKFEADPEGFCQTVRPAEASCISVPARMAITPELRVFVNGKAVHIMAGGSVGHALRAAGVKDQKALAPRLQVLRPWGGQLLPVEFDRTRGDILGLVPIGGEQIRW